MAEPLKKVRKGTRSCTECRRRKVRCTWSSDQAPRCRRCEERGSNCVAQIYSIQAAGSKRLTSKDRIARLESQVTTLTKALHAENQGVRPNVVPLDTPVTDYDGETDSESDHSSIESDGFTQDPPAHLSTLFENDLISTDASKREGHHLQRNKILTELSTAVRRKLQELIPPRREVEIIASFASSWLSLFHSLFPAPSMIQSGEEMVSQYETFKSSTVDPSYLASWLLSIAMTIHQVPKDKLGPEDELKGFRNASQFSKSVSDAVEATIMRYDGLLGTIEGIDTAMLFLRLQLSRGNFKKTWLQLRRVIAVAELIGLHRAARRTALPGSPEQDAIFWSKTFVHENARKAQVWESLCSVDRIAGMMFNLPPGTRRYRLPQNMNIISDGTISLRAYLCSLSEIAIKVQDLDDLELPQYADAELYANVLKIDGELRVLASVVPAAWWSNPLQLTDQLLQYWHYYITIRVHLPFTLRHDTSEQYSFSRLACMKACQTLVHRYRILRPLLPGGFFLCRIVDLQVFTAVVVLILAYHAASPAERQNLHAHGAQPPELQVPELLEYMMSIYHDPVADFVRQAVDAVGLLTELLNGDKQKQVGGDLKLKVPLLGKVHVRRKKQELMTTSTAQTHADSDQYMQTDPPQMDSSSAQTLANNSLAYTTGETAVDSGQTGYMWDPLSWSIEDDQSGVFQDTLFTEEFSPFGPWWDQSSMSQNT